MYPKVLNCKLKILEHNFGQQIWAFVDELLRIQKLVLLTLHTNQKLMVLLFHGDLRHCTYIEILPLFFDLEHNFSQ